MNKQGKSLNRLKPGLHASYFFSLLLLTQSAGWALNPARELEVGRAGHAFEHLGAISNQARAAAAIGANVIYPSGVGAEGYSGLPPAAEFEQRKRAAAAYIKQSKKFGVRLALSYLCATSMVKLETFDRHWSDDFRARFKTKPSQWRQQGIDGQPLPSWYGGDYHPACMNHPDWREYQKFMVEQQLQAGHDGIFFDNPTVHPQGCYCPHCLEKFARFLEEQGNSVTNRSLAALRELARRESVPFLKFRGRIASDFLAAMRRHARSLKSQALITCNNSLNSPEVFFSQARSYGYNLWELSQVEDFVLVEDMGHQPRTTSAGRTYEYGPTYELLHAISHGKPVVAATIADGDYHTAPRLVRLAMAEAVAHQATYLSWPTWPENERTRMIESIRPQADWLRRNRGYFEGSRNRADLLLFFPFRKWLEGDPCRPVTLAAELSRRNVPFQVVAEDGLGRLLTQSGRGRRPWLLVDSPTVFNPDEKKVVERFVAAGGKLLSSAEPEWISILDPSTLSLHLTAPATVRAVLRDQDRRTVLHLLNLNVRRVSSFQDEVVPAEKLRITCRVPFSKIHSVRVTTADSLGTRGRIPYTVSRKGGESWVEFAIPRLEISALVVIE